MVPTPTLPLSRTDRPNWEESVLIVVNVSPVVVPNPLTVNWAGSGPDDPIPTLPAEKILKELLAVLAKDGVVPEKVRALLLPDNVKDENVGVPLVVRS